MKRPLRASFLTAILDVVLLCPSVSAALVTNVNDDGPGSLRAAMAGSDSTILFDPLVFSSPQTIKLLSPLPSISRHLNILGPGADLLRIDGALRPFDDALLTFRSQNNVVWLEGFTLTGGYQPTGSGQARVDGTSGIFSRANLTLVRMNIADNRGIAVFNQGGNLNVWQSSFIGNRSEQAIVDTGTGVFNQAGVARIVNSTFAENSTGAWNQQGDLAIYNSTFANNTTNGVVSSIFLDVDPFPPVVPALTIESSLFADNGLADLGALVITSINHSLIKQAPTAPVVGIGNIVGVDPLLGPLAFNGGPTRTMLPQPGSQAINAGSNPLFLAEDQRGAPRVWGQAIDIGAVESIPEPAALTLSAVVLVAAMARRSMQWK